VRRGRRAEGRRPGQLHRQRAERQLIARALAVFLLVLFWAAPAHARKVRVRGGAQIRAQAVFKSGGEVLELSGSLRDDGALPMKDAYVEVTPKGELRIDGASGCTIGAGKPTTRGGLADVKTAADGRFCLRWLGAPARGAITLRFAGDAYHSAADLEVAFDRDKEQKVAMELRFDPRPLWIDLDKDEAAVGAVLDLVVETEHAERGDLEVKLLDETDAVLGSGRTSGDGKVHFQLQTEAMAGPGPGRLKLVFAGTTELAEAKDEQPIVRRAGVTLELAEAVEPADPGDDATVHVALGSRRGPVDGGVVEALLDGVAAGSAPVREGKADLTVVLDPRRERPADLVVRYAPSAPYYRAGAPLEVTIPLAPPSNVLRLLLAALVLAAAAWVTLSWRRSRRPPPLGSGRPLLVPGVHVVHSVRGGKSWKGTVVDAHEGSPLPGAEVLVRAPTLEGTDVLVSLVTDARGMFAFDLPSPPEGAEILARSSTHSEERKALPAGGTLRIALVTRRRALVRRLVDWARARGKPYDVAPEPTPAHVGHVGTEHARPEVQSWASAVERAAFGPDEVDASVEKKVRDVEPGP
jgi:hypothetical protein